MADVTQTIILGAGNQVIASMETRNVIISQGKVITVNTGNTTGLSSPFTCAEAVSAYQILAAFGSEVRPASAANLSHATNVVGIALSDCQPGESVDVVTHGRVTFAGWNWDDSLGVYLSTVPGELVQDDPEASDGATFSLRVGTVRDPDTIDLQILHSILY